MAETELDSLPASLPAISDESLRKAGLPPIMEMSPGLAIFFDDALYQRCKNIASMMSRASSMTPAHLREKPEACFAVVSRSIVWKLDPFAVAMSTYQTPGGSIGYEGKLIQAILEMSGRIVGQITFTHKGDWSVLRRKFKLQKGSSGKEYPVPTWTLDDAGDLAVVVSAQIKGETTPRELEFELASAWPLNSPLWATDPKRQICYTAIRAFANLAAPSLLFGIPFDVDPTGLADMRDITPSRPDRSEFERAAEREHPGLGDWTAKVNFAKTVGEVAQLRKDGLAALPVDLHARFDETCDGRARQIASAIPEGDQQPEPPPPDHDNSRGSADDQDDKETPFQRGVRLLGLVTLSADVRDVFETIVEELKGKKDRDLWRQTAEARFKELGGQGPMLVDAKKRK